MTAAVPDPRFRDQLAEVLKAHTVVAFAGCDSMCACDRKWRTNIAYREHLAAEVEARVQAAADQRAVEERVCAGGPGDCGGDPVCPVACPYVGAAALASPAPS